MRGTRHRNVDLGARHEWTFADNPEYFYRLEQDLLPLARDKEAFLEKLAEIKGLLKDGKYP
jgi:hypothetical protein